MAFRQVNQFTRTSKLAALTRVYRTTSCCCHTTKSPFPNVSETQEEYGVKERFKNVMKSVPLPVVVVTSALYDQGKRGWLKRGVTCSSFTSISFDPPIISFAVTTKSRMHNIVTQSERFAVHVLAKNQVGYGAHFAKAAIDGTDQFESIAHEQDEQGLPILRDTMGVFLCRPHSIHTIGDHHVWYGTVEHAYRNSQVMDPLLYYRRSFRAIGDEAFMQAFEDTTLPFKDWTHEAHIRMAWNYVRDFGKEEAEPIIKTGIKKYNAQNQDKISRGYHETVTMFYINTVSEAVSRSSATTFEDFLAENSYLLDKHLLFQYYSDERINSKLAITQYVPPDKKPLPGTKT